MNVLFRELVLLTLIFVPVLARAQENQPGFIGGERQPPSGGNSVQLVNPLKSDSLIGFFQDILDVILVFAVPIIVFFIIYAGFQYVMAQGKPDAISKANHALLYAIIGGVIILGAYVILEVIGGTVDALGS